MTSIRHVATGLGLAALLALSGCGAATETTDTAAKTDIGSSPAAQTTPDYPTQAKKACEVLTADIAKTLLGSVGDESAPAPDPGSAGVNVSSCVRANTVVGFDKTRSVSLLMRVATSQTGAESNESVFTTGSLPTGAQQVDGYGDKAFWNPAFGQLNIFENGNWYILSSGQIDPRTHTLADTLKLADALKSQL
jgi:hypothetical protein